MMIFAHTHQWITGVSPYTGKPKTITRRVKKTGDDYIWYDCIQAIERNGRIIYQLDQTLAVQTGRTQKAIARTPPLTWLGYQDCRNITELDAHAEGFASRLHFLYTWSSMYDKHVTTAIKFADRFSDLAAAEYLHRLNRTIWDERPAALYDCWVLDWSQP